jgi:MFS family permease
VALAGKAEGRMDEPRAGLWQHPDFLKLWAGESVSLLGSQVTVLAMPLLAAVTLEASPLQMGILGTLQYIPWLLVGLFAGAWADRARRRPVMIGADLGRAILLAAIPIASLASVLRMDHLYGICFLVGVLSVVFDVAYSAYLPTLIPVERLLEGNSKLQASASVAEIVGPGIGGMLVQIISAPLAIAVDAVSFAVSGLCLAWIHASEPSLRTHERARRILPEVQEGLRLVFANPILRAFSLTSAVANFCIDMHLAVFILFATRELDVSPSLLGAMYAVASIGGLVGSLSAGRLVDRLGVGRAIVGGHALVVAALLLIPLSVTRVQFAVPLIVLAQAFWGFGAVVYVVNSVSLRQAITPNSYQGRVMASLRFVSWGVAPLGFLAGGVMGESRGLWQTLLVAGIASMLSLAFLVLSPVWGVRWAAALDDSSHAMASPVVPTDV